MLGVQERIHISVVSAGVGRRDHIQLAIDPDEFEVLVDQPVLFSVSHLEGWIAGADVAPWPAQAFCLCKLSPQSISPGRDLTLLYGFSPRQVARSYGFLPH